MHNLITIQLQLGLLQFRTGIYVASPFSKDTEVSIWNGHVSNIILDLKDTDFEDFAYAMRRYHPAIHIQPPLTARYRTAPRIGHQEISEDEDEPVNAFDDADPDVPFDNFDDDWSFVQMD